MGYIEQLGQTDNNFSEYANKANKLDGEKLMLLHYCIGASTEANELLDHMKKVIFYEREIDVVNIKEECGDILWYIAGLCRMYNWSMEDLMATNLSKLKARYGDKFSTTAALNRDLDTERKILEESEGRS